IPDFSDPAFFWQRKDASAFGNQKGFRFVKRRPRKHPLVRGNKPDRRDRPKVSRWSSRRYDLPGTAFGSAPRRYRPAQRSTSAGAPFSPSVRPNRHGFLEFAAE